MQVQKAFMCIFIHMNIKTTKASMGMLREMEKTIGRY